VGKFRRGIESSDAELLAAVADYDDVLVSLLAEVAANYIGIRPRRRARGRAAATPSSSGSFDIATDRASTAR
jgi:outer membrane protein TolC